jgi:hypothetical protein
MHFMNIKGRLIMKCRVAIFAGLVILLTGCTMDALMSAQNWREYIGDGGMATSKTVLVVDRKFTDIGKDWSERARACLNNHQVASGGGARSVRVGTSFKSTSVITKQRAELHLQEQISGAGVVNVTKEPPDGHFFFVADAIPLAPNKTRVEMYHAAGRSLFVSAISNWAKGTNMGCPDLTQM